MKSVKQLEQAIEAWQIGVKAIEGELARWPSAPDYNQLEWYNYHIDTLSRVKDNLNNSSDPDQIEGQLEQELNSAKNELDAENERLAKLFRGEKVYNSKTSALTTKIRLLEFALRKS